MPSEYNVAPGGYWLYRTTNSFWIGGGPAGEEHYGQGPHQHTVDFDLLGEYFRIGFGGGLGSTGVSAPGFTWNIRIGGAYAVAIAGPSNPPITGDLVTIGLTGAVAAFGTWMIFSDPVENVWEGVNLVKLTGSLPGGGGFALNPTLFIFPAV